MVSSDYEAQLAREGATGSAESQLAFQEEFALAESVAAKAELVQRSFMPESPDFLYYGALCEVLEVQKLVEEEQYAEAWQRLSTVKAQLGTMELQLQTKSCSKRADRILNRRLLLELELQTKLNKPREEIATTTQQITTSLHVDFLDPEPAQVSTEVRKETYPTSLSDSVLDLDARIQSKLSALVYSTTKDTALKALLQDLDVFGREKTFQKVCAWDGPESERWVMLEVFLDAYAFEYADIPGYVDVIVKDVERKRDEYKGYSFNYRAAHRNLSFLQLLECAKRAPDVFRSNSEFAFRGMQLLQAAAEVDSAQSSDLRSEAQNERELQHIETYLEFLRGFTPTLVHGLQMKTLYRKLELLNLVSWTRPEALVGLLEALVEYVKVSGGCFVGLSNIGGYGFANVSQTSHTAILEKSLRMLWASDMNDDVVHHAIRPHLDDTFLEVQYALSMIKLGKGEFSNWIAKLSDKGQELSLQASSSEVFFCESNPTFLLPEDPLRIFVRARNVKTLTAHLYEIKTLEYYSRLRREIKGDICLDGLLPTEEQVIDLSHLTAWQEARVPIEFLATKNARRGVFVVEVFEKGVTCRAILRKGFLRHVERITTQGHEFTVLDERGNLLDGARALVLNVKSGKAQLGREYTADEKGSITIPFRHPNDESSSDTFAIAFCYGAFGYFHGSFNYLPEVFDVDIDIHIDSEQLIPGCIAQIVTRPRLLVAGIATGESLGTLVDVKLVVDFNLVNTSSVGASSHKEVLSFPSMQQIVSHPPSFEIPMDAESFNVTLKASVFRSTVSQDNNFSVNASELPEVADSKQFIVQRVNSFGSTYTAHFARRSLESGNPYSPNVFSVFALGHNGEPIPNVRAAFVFKLVHSKDDIQITLQSDVAGEIKLGQLQDVERLMVQFGGSTGSFSWELPNLRSYRPQIVNCSVDETVEIPVPFAFSSRVDTWVKDNLVSVCEVVDTVLQNAMHCAEVGVLKSKLNCHIGFAVQLKRAGKYVIYLRSLNLKYSVTVSEKKNLQTSLPLGLIVQPTQILLATPTLPLMICAQQLKMGEKEKIVLEIQLRNASRNSTQVLVFLKHFLDPRNNKVSEVLVGDGLKSVSSSGARLPKLSFPSSPLENDFLKMRKISDEYAYILQRRALVSAKQNSLIFLGVSSIPKPSLLQNPFVASETDMEVVNVEAGDKVTGFKSVEAHGIQSGGNLRNSMPKKKMSRTSSNGYGGGMLPSISFLGQQSQLIASASVDGDGLVRIDLSDQPFFSGDLGSFEVCTVAFDYTSGYICTQEVPMTLPGVGNKVVFPKRDIRLSVEEALPPCDHFHQTDSHECMHPGEVKAMPRSFSSKFALYESLEGAMDLWPTLASDGNVGKLVNTLKEWWSLSVCEKNRFYYANACDDLHFYLFRKDPEYFKQYAAPLVAAKICKSLVDYYVLGDETSLQRFYLGPAAFQRLSCVEKLLLAERMTNTEVKNRICRAVINEIESVYPLGCVNTLTRVFNTVLYQGQVAPAAVPNQDSSLAFGASSDIPAPISRARMRSAYIPTSPAYSCTSPAAPGGGVSFGFSATAQSFGAAQTAKRDLFVAETTETTETTEITEITEIEEAYVEYDDDDFGVRSFNSDSEEDDAEDDEGSQENKRKRKPKQEIPYIPPGKVRKVQEKRYFASQLPTLSGCNMFWKEYAEYLLRCQENEGARRRFVSSYFPEALVSITEGLFALAVLDLQKDAELSQVQLTSSSDISISPTSDVVLYHRSIGPAESSSAANTMLILKQYIRDEQGDSSTELLVNKVYSTIVTLSNIGSENLTDVNLLLQIPQGALPMGPTGFYTKTEIGNVAPNHTSQFVFSFYFPEGGIFSQYPARASIGGTVIAWAKVQDCTNTCKVVRSATRVNLASWTDVSARGSLEDVLNFMKSAKRGVKIDYQQLYWRCHDDEFFRGLVNYLRLKMIFVSGVWKYGLFHRDQQTMMEFFASSNSLSHSVGSGFCSSYINETRLYSSERFRSMFEQFDHCEFGPFVTRRVHPVTGKVNAQISWGAEVGKTSGKRILNPEARRYYGELCQRLGTHTRMSEQNLLVMAFYMILFDRIEDAIKMFGHLEKRGTSGRVELQNTVQYAYLSAFLDFFRSNDHQGRTFAVARRVISQYAAYPQPRWQHRFKKMEEFLEEFDAFETRSLRRLQHLEVEDTPMETSGNDCFKQEATTTRGSQVHLEAGVDNGVVTLLSQSLRACNLSFYPIDVELMFSTEPFNTFSNSAASASSLLLVEPRQQLSIDLAATPGDGAMSQTIVEIPSELRSVQMMLRIREVSSSRTVSTVAPPIDIIRPYFNSSLNVDIMTQWGMLQVLHDGLPVRSCYVKVYAKVSSGEEGRAHKTEFYKDGYTDLLGKFDYVGINGDLISNVEKFSILISHDKFGASVEQADPPVLATTVGDFSSQQERELLLY